MEKKTKEKIDKILATYKPVEDKPGYVWMDCWTYVKESTLRKAYEEAFEDETKDRTSDTEETDLCMDSD